MTLNKMELALQRLKQKVKSMGDMISRQGERISQLEDIITNPNATGTDNLALSAGIAGKDKVVVKKTYRERFYEDEFPNFTVFGKYFVRFFNGISIMIPAEMAKTVGYQRGTNILKHLRGEIKMSPMVMKRFHEVLKKHGAKISLKRLVKMMEDSLLPYSERANSSTKTAGGFDEKEIAALSPVQEELY